ERTHIMPSETFSFVGSPRNLTIRPLSNIDTYTEAAEFEDDHWRNHVPISAPMYYDVI
ncbi:hypothetical protein Angca_001015, partial [Angiostrongylus cantonensis]